MSEQDKRGYNAEMFESTAASSVAHNAEIADNGLDYLEQNHSETLSHYTAKTFAWMFLGLLATFAVSLAFYMTGAFYILFALPMLPFFLAIAELAVVLVLSMRINKIKAGTAYVLFFAYAILNGLTFASFFVIYDVGSLIFVFGVTALYFGAMSVYGYFTKRDLTNIGRILTFGLIFLIVFGVLSMLFGQGWMNTVMCLVGIAIFMGLTAYDTQKIKAYHATFGTNAEMAAKGSIICALQLYLDFINMFLYLLRFLGRSRK